MSDLISSAHYEEEGDTLILETKQDCEPIIKEVKLLRDNQKGKDMWHVGRLPAVIVEKYCNEVGINLHEFMNDNTHITKIMNDPDYSHFRILEG